MAALRSSRQTSLNWKFNSRHFSTPNELLREVVAAAALIVGLKEAENAYKPIEATRTTTDSTYATRPSQGFVHSA